MIDMHTHWRPAALADALRARTREPRIVRNPEGVEVLKTRAAEQPLSHAFDDVDRHLAAMGRQGVTTSVLSLRSSFCWIEAEQPVEESIQLCQTYNNGISKVCAEHAGRFAAYAALPLLDMAAAAVEFERALKLPGIIGTQLRGDSFLTRKEAETMRPLLEVANRHRAIIFIHHAPRAGEAARKFTQDTDNTQARNNTLDMQAHLSSVMVTLCLTDFLTSYPNAIIHVHNLGGNIPYEMERMDHRSLLDTPDNELPSTAFRRSRVYVDCNSFGPRAIEAAIDAYGTERIVCGTDGSEFGCEWTRKALAEAHISDEVRDKILYANAAALLSHLTPLPQREKAAA